MCVNEWNYIYMCLFNFPFINIFNIPSPIFTIRLGHHLHALNIYSRDQISIKYERNKK